MSECWETCVQSITTEANRHIVYDVVKAGLAAKRMKDINYAYGVGFLIDQSVVPGCPDGSSSEFNEDVGNELEAGMTPTDVFNFELQLMFVINTIIGYTTSSFVLYDSSSGSFCDNMYCLDQCDMAIPFSSGDYAPNTTVANCRPDLIEPACRASYKLFQWDCGDYAYTNFTVAIMNSNTHTHVHKEGPYSDYSPCHTLFPNRFAIGVNSAKKDDLKRFASGDDFYRYIPTTPESLEVVDSLYYCMWDECCDNDGSMDSVNTCDIFWGHDGEDWSEYDVE